MHQDGISNRNIQVSVEAEDFDVNQEYHWLRENQMRDGAIVTFVGLVRDMNAGEKVQKLCLEHYPAMAFASLQSIAKQATERWRLGKIRVIHRFGELDLGDQIVFVGVTSMHRGDAFAAAEFIMDFLKTNAPFWKKEQTAKGSRWVDAKQSDQDKTASWQK
ncbi:molybdopterin synthase catalytic subunit MoaE [Alteromonas sp. a30]|uniref:molybdopterin synthase catalytic subunit MoaE n=1 Tax=Alteromonas sp. a30 TaxID=2730917 RepID=UPI002282413B|nr:molybdopterin synthase catalytic subunit MoaE [Alteromonas sp. a30]MCY7296412.1 molybdopterin synthase catalytic subunit MoaE [Alteromonas sp. a30]